MLSNIIKVGMNLELSQETDSKEENTIAGVVYSSKIQDIFPNGDLEIDMPMYQQKLVLLHNGVRYKVVFYAQNNAYTAIGEVVDRYKSGNMYLIRLELKTQPVKFQRREFFRFECMMDFSFHDVIVNEDEESDLSKALERVRMDDPDQDWKTAMALDISGGGIRFISKEELVSGNYERFLFELPISGKIKEIDALGIVLSSNRVDGSRLKFENRVRFAYLSNAAREEIIRFIFEEERKARKNLR